MTSFKIGRLLASTALLAMSCGSGNDGSTDAGGAGGTGSGGKGGVSSKGGATNGGATTTGGSATGAPQGGDAGASLGGGPGAGGNDAAEAGTSGTDGEGGRASAGGSGGRGGGAGGRVNGAGGTGGANTATGGRGSAMGGTSASAGGRGGSVGVGGRGGATAGGGAPGNSGGTSAGGRSASGGATGGAPASGGTSSASGGTNPGSGGTNGNVPMLPKTSGSGTFTISGRQETAIRIVVPSGLGASPPLVIAFHPTGGEPSEAISDFSLEQNASKYKFVAVAPRAGYRNGNHPADVDHERNGGDSSWNMWSQGLANNEDLRYVVALIDSAHATFNVDTTRVYTVGFSNGAFFSYFVAASLPDRIAGFAENSGGWTTKSCPTQYNSTSYQQRSSSVPNGTVIACSTLFADSGFPSECLYSSTNPLVAPALTGRVPFGYLAHYSSDDTVSVQWSCYLAQALGARGKENIRFQDTDGTRGHNMQPDAFERAWEFFAGRSTSD